MNVSSVVVKVLPKNIDEMVKKLKNIPNVDYHFHDELGRIIITIEAQNVSEEVAILSKIEKLKNVISADMSYSYAEEELEREKNMVGKMDEGILEFLKDDNDKVVYSGSVYSHLDKKKNS